MHRFLQDNVTTYKVVLDGIVCSVKDEDNTDIFSKIDLGIKQVETRKNKTGIQISLLFHELDKILEIKLTNSQAKALKNNLNNIFN